MTTQLDTRSDLNAIAARAANALRASGKKVSETDIQDAQIRARKLVDEARADPSKNPRDGLEAMRNLALSIGLPVPRILLAEMIKASSASASRKKKLIARLPKISEVSETGCIKVDFPVTKNGKSSHDTAFLVLDQCAPDHDLGAQIYKLFSRISADKQDEIRKHLSMLIALGRRSFGTVVAENKNLLKEIANGLPADFPVTRLMIDTKNTTFFMAAPCKTRVGIFIRFESELADSLPQQKKG